MNYYEHHIGDYDKNTAHLTACEDGIYCRLIRRYYDKERALDADTNEIKRVVRARTREEKSAVDAMLREFFHLEVDGWHHDKCDQVIADFQAGEPEREAKKKNEDTRLARHRLERAELFNVINGAGLHAAWNTPIAELRATAERIRSGAPPEPATRKPRTPATQPATAPATPATATHTPFPIHHSPDTTPQTPDTSHQTPKDVPVVGAEPTASTPVDQLAADAASTPAERGTRLPKDWELPKAWGAWALGEYPLWTEAKVRREASSFRDHWCAKSGKDATKLDWLATWRNWCRSDIAHRDDPKPRVPVGAPATTQGVRAVLGLPPQGEIIDMEQSHG